MGGNVIREHVCALMETIVQAEMFPVLAWDEHFVGVFTRETRAVARYREDAARETIAEVKSN